MPRSPNNHPDPNPTPARQLASPDDYFEDEGSEGRDDVVPGAPPGSPRAAAAAQPPNAQVQQQSDADPAGLIALLEEAIPKQLEGGKQPSTAEIQQRREMAEHTWDLVRRWLWAHPDAEQRRAAAYIRGQADAAPLHLMCKIHNPPEDVVMAVLESAEEVASWTDSHGWLPLHHACANGASNEVMRALVEAYPAGKLQQDNQSRTPLHFYATRNMDNALAMAANATLLSDGGAAELTDRGGMLPMHYACAYGTHPAVLEVLGNVYPESLTAKENKGRTPMHLAMVNAHRDDIPHVIRFLLEHSPESRGTINTRDQDGYLPIHLLALGLRGYRADDPMKRNNVSECLSMYLDAEPVAAADFFTAIQDLPDWLQDTAVVSGHVRNILNNRIVQPLPTSILMLDGYMLVVLIVCFGISSSNHINIRFDPDNPANNKDDTLPALRFLYVGASYFLLREVIQMLSLASMGSLGRWWTDPGNWLDTTLIFMTYYYAVLMSDDSLGWKDDAFRNGAAITQGVLFCSVIVYLKSTYVGFAVFVGGVLYVVRRLSAFLLAVGVILLLFAQMFFFVYVETPLCEPLNPNSTFFDPEEPDEFDCRFPHCTFERSLLKVYTMMMGEIGDETRYSEGPTTLIAQLLYVAYAFIVVILLSNVLIAVVTDSYEIIQSERAAIVFWSNRLDFVAEMDAIIFGAQRRLGGCFGKQQSAPGAPRHVQETATGPGVVTMGSGTLVVEGSSGMQEYFRLGWQQVMVLFDANLYDELDIFEAWVYNFFRIFAILIVIPLWICVGLISAGWLWPPQIREALFVQKEAVISRSELERKKLEKLASVQAEMLSLKQELSREMTNDRDEMMRMKAEVETVQSEVITDLQQVKELLASLLGE